MSHSHDSHTGSHALHTHVMPLRTLFTIFGILVALTILTLVVSQFHLGSMEVVIALTIATVKAILVAVYFMHLRYDNPFNAMIFCFSLIFVALFLGFTLVDVNHYQADLIPPTVEPAPPQ